MSHFIADQSNRHLVVKLPNGFDRIRRGWPAANNDVRHGFVVRWLMSLWIAVGVRRSFDVL
jgi:hypothetical protein